MTDQDIKPNPVREITLLIRSGLIQQRQALEDEVKAINLISESKQKQIRALGMQIKAMEKSIELQKPEL